MKNNNSFGYIRTLCAVAMFCSLAYVVSFCIPIKVQFLTFDAKDAIITIGGMFFGPFAALAMSIIVPVLEIMTLSDTGIYGLIMNCLSSAAFSVTASLVYKSKRKMSGALLGLFSGIIAMVTIMMVANIIVTPIYMGITQEAVIELIPTLLLPFNVAKSVLNAALVLLLYKPFTTALRATNNIPDAPERKNSIWYSILAVIIAALLISAAIYLYFTVLDASFTLAIKK